MLTNYAPSLKLAVAAAALVAVVSACNGAARPESVTSNSSGDSPGQTAQAATDQNEGIYSASGGDYPSVNSVSDLVRMADVIVVGRVTAVTDSSRDLGEGLKGSDVHIESIDSSVTVSVDRALRGSTPSAVTVIQVRGHKFLDYVTLFQDVRVMKADHEYVLFLRGLGDGTYAGVTEPFKFELLSGSAIPDASDSQGLQPMPESALYSEIASALGTGQ